MRHALPIAACLLATAGWGQPEKDPTAPGVVLGANRHLVAGAAAVRRGRFDEAIREITKGLETTGLDPAARAAGHANLCAAYVSKERPDDAIPHCDEALGIDDRSWRAYTIRARAYLLKGMYRRARLDNDAAAAIAPDAEHVRMIAGQLNEIELEPRVVIEEHE